MYLYVYGENVFFFQYIFADAFLSPWPKNKRKKKPKWYYNMLFFVLPRARAWWETNIAAWLQVKSRIIYILITKLRLKILFLVR